MGHLGLSWVGLVYIILLFVPNIIWAKNRKARKASRTEPENRVLLLMERGGQATTMVLILVFRDTNLSGYSPWVWWLTASAFFLLLYEAAWVRCFVGEITPDKLYQSLLGIPMPLATLPVFSFLLLGVYGRVIWLIASSTVLGVGHIGIHFRHRRTLAKREGEAL